jgi:hypothetical protein
MHDQFILSIIIYQELIKIELRYNKSETINVYSDLEMAIKYLTELITKIIEFK